MCFLSLIKKGWTFFLHLLLPSCNFLMGFYLAAWQTQLLHLQWDPRTLNIKNSPTGLVFNKRLLSPIKTKLLLGKGKQVCFCLDGDSESLYVSVSLCVSVCGVTKSGNLCSGRAVTSIQGTGGPLPSCSSQVSFPRSEKKQPSKVGTNWPPCWQSQQRCQSEWAWNPAQTLHGFLLRSRLRCFGREVWGKLTLPLSVSRSVKLPPFLSAEAQGFGF